MDRKELIKRELDLLRDELSSLKECQIRYFWSSVTATSVLIGLGSRIDSGTAAIVFISPLLVILPCWLVFFDKATTITRIVGYVRTLEYELIADAKIHNLIGWENALALFRDQQREGADPLLSLARLWNYVLGARRAAPLLIGFQRTHRYWSITWLTFFGLAAISSGLAWTPQAAGHVAFKVVAIVIALVVLVHNAYMLDALTNGAFSYDENEKRWHSLLHSLKAGTYLERRFRRGP